MSNTVTPPPTLNPPSDPPSPLPPAPSGGPSPCFVCPNDADVANPDVVVPNTGGDFSCADLQSFGRQGQIPAEDCAQAQMGIPVVCGCNDDGSTSSVPPVDSPPPSGPPTNSSSVPPPTATETNPDDVPSVSGVLPPCFVCPSDANVANPDILVPNSGSASGGGDGDDFTCGELQFFGRQGFIPPEDCTQAQAGVPLICGCVTPPRNNTCFEVEPFGRPSCNDPDCLAKVCAIENTCCSTSYAEECVDRAMQVCTSNGTALSPAQAQNHCFQPSTSPGCSDQVCLEEAVCPLLSTCCTEAYTPECVEIARNNHNTSCSLPSISVLATENDCKTTPSYQIGSCLDRRCAQNVCDVRSDCCLLDPQTGELGRWHDGCVIIANELCQPPVYEREPGPCPIGFTCSETHMANCTEIQQQATDTLLIGDVYAGVYCGEYVEGGYNLVNCPIGQYCPTPELQIPCPAGYFCPHKTAIPEIVCNRCEEAATKLQRDWFGFVVVIMVAALVLSFTIYRLCKRQGCGDGGGRGGFVVANTRSSSMAVQDQEDLDHRRRATTQILQLGRKTNGNSTKQEFKKMKVKIDLINKRLESIQRRQIEQQNQQQNDDDENGLGSSQRGGTRTTPSVASSSNEYSNNAPTTTSFNTNDTPSSYNRVSTMFDGTLSIVRTTLATLNPSKAIDATTNGQNSIYPDGNLGTSFKSKGTINVAKVFDTLDVNSTGEISYNELNKILALNDLELGEFKRRMNELAGYKNFPQHNNNIVSRTKFCKFFLQVLKETTNLTVSYEEAGLLFDEMAKDGSDTIHMSVFYNSSISDFLSDVQICELIRRFEKINIEVSRRSTRSGDILGASLHSASGFFNRTTSMRRRSSSSAGTGGGGGGGGGIGQSGRHASRMILRRDDFVENYPQLLIEVTLDHDLTMREYLREEEGHDDDYFMVQNPGVDICFKDLSLNIHLGDKTVAVVDSVTGRIPKKAMTAIMGGSGAGKTSLLNALCGRAFYGEVSGSVFLNGHENTSVENFKDCAGFVPQDDIVYPELTVRENLMYAGRFRLPRGTLDEEIYDLANMTMANLGLSRVADNIVGDVRKRGVSGGERKRVNIGLELMANPSILFLDEPTSGLDASSALLVMKSLKHLVEKDAVTVVSVIHQPRKFIYDLFDSVILLGIGGRMVYHGPTDAAVSYFNKLRYRIPEGESVADWLIDISSGRVEPEIQLTARRSADTGKNSGDKRRKADRKAANYSLVQASGDIVSNNTSSNEKFDSIEIVPLNDSKEEKKERPPVSTKSPLRNSSVGLVPSLVSDQDRSSDNSGTQVSKASAEKAAPNEVVNGGHYEQNQANSMASSDSFDFQDASMDDTSRGQESIGEMSLSAGLTTAGRYVTDVDVVGARGVVAGKVIQAAKEAKNRREWLYSEWDKYFESMDTEKKKNYNPPNPYPLPIGIQKPSFLYQLIYQTTRIFTVAWRNRRSKLIDSIIIIGALIVITALDGVTVVTNDMDPDVPFDVMVRPTSDDSEELFIGLFRFAITRQIQYALKAGIVICALIGLTATKVLTEKRLMFFRESASGYNLNAYFVAVNIMATTEHTIQVLIAAFFAIWIRNPLASGASFVVHFVLLAWIVVSWSLLIPMVTPPETVMIVGAFFFVFCALMFSGVFPPIIYKDIYDGGSFQEIFAGWIGATRFFFEAITVGEYRCLPEQTGYTISTDAINRDWNTSMIVALGYAGHDPFASQQSCDGWYWSVLPSILVGLTVRYASWLCMYGFQRGLQTKKPLWGLMATDLKIFRDVMLYVLLLLGLFAVTTWTFVRDIPYDEDEDGT